MSWEAQRACIDWAMNAALLLPGLLTLAAIVWQLVVLRPGVQRLGGVAVAISLLVGTVLAWVQMEFVLSKVDSDAESGTYVIVGALVGTGVALLWIPASLVVRMVRSRRSGRATGGQTPHEGS